VARFKTVNGPRQKRESKFREMPDSIRRAREDVEVFGVSVDCSWRPAFEFQPPGTWAKETKGAAVSESRR
jgi:hypothetical protein